MEWGIYLSDNPANLNLELTLCVDRGGELTFTLTPDMLDAFERCRVRKPFGPDTKVKREVWTLTASSEHYKGRVDMELARFARDADHEADRVSEPE